MNTETWVLMPIYSKRVNRYAVKKSQNAGFPIYKLINWHLDCAELAKGIVIASNSPPAHLLWPYVSFTSGK